MKGQKDVQLAAKKEYDFAFECELAGMTVAEFIRWNPTFGEAEAGVRIAAAKAKVARRLARSGEKLKLDLDEEKDAARCRSGLPFAVNIQLRARHVLSLRRAHSLGR